MRCGLPEYNKWESTGRTSEILYEENSWIICAVRVVRIVRMTNQSSQHKTNGENEAEISLWLDYMVEPTTLD